MVVKRSVVWTILARKQLKEIFEYIKESSLQNAEDVRNKIFESANSLIENPEKFPIDKYKENNDGTFRAYEIYKYRISYSFSENKIIVLRVRSTKMQPKKY